MKPIKVCENSADLIDQLAKCIVSCYRKYETEKIFSVGLSGGSLVGLLCKVLPILKDSVDMGKWRFFFCDERMVPFDDGESTFGAYWKALEPIASQFSLSQNQFATINHSLDGSECAADYANKICSHGVTIDDSNGLPKFNILLLGMGPDGHTASLFPHHSLLEAKGSWVEFINDSPKPPAKRITLTFPVINNASSIVFVVTGSSKADTVKKILINGEDLPAGRVNPINGDLLWLLDKDAASQIPTNLQALSL
ncbi:6-phosphogluconolactonase [Brevipalpus obovatus]|uniref:6-phosphogluconolactonase n=1 Tax=Brevipalpus obovatus TaxID=246614 RepID=UPI003D9E24C7